MGLLDFLTGGENDKAQDALSRALAQLQNVSVPTANDLQLTPLQQYTDTGNLTPAQMEAAQAGPSAFSSEKLSDVPMSTMQQVLAKENEIASSNGMTPQEQAAIAQAEADVNRNTAGQRGAIAQDFAQRGIPAALISAALQNQTVGQDAQQANLSALGARANAANTGQQALANEGSLASTMFSQNAGQANAVASAQDALAKFNAANTQQANVANQATNQAANVYNTTNKQNVSNTNVGNANDRQRYNETVAPVTAAQLALQKAGGSASIGEAQAASHESAGQQQAGLFGGILGAGATLGAGAMNPGTTINLGGSGLAEGGEIPPRNIPATNFVSGGPVPGAARAPGNDPRNDTVPARLSPGEFVVPRTAMARPEVRSFLAREVPTPRPPAGAHPTDVAAILKAMSMLRAGA